MTTDEFLKWLKLSQTDGKATLENKVIVIGNGYDSQKEIDALNFSVENAIEIIICLLPHCTHR